MMKVAMVKVVAASNETTIRLRSFQASDKKGIGMKNLAFLAGLLVFTVSFALADAADEAEAKKRGVAVELVQLEKARAENAELRAKIELLAADNATYVKQMMILEKEIKRLREANAH